VRPSKSQRLRPASKGSVALCDYNLMFRNLELLKEEAIASNKRLRFSFGWNAEYNAEYKALWCYESLQITEEVS
jgi:hypothetical protein